MASLQCYPDMLVISMVADVLGTTEKAAKKLVVAGGIESIEIDGNILIPKAFLEEFIEKSRQIWYNYKEESGEAKPPEAAPMYLDNSISLRTAPSMEGDSEMAKKFNQAVVINGEKHWITAKGAQEFADKVSSYYQVTEQEKKHLFETYAMDWFRTYSSPNIEMVTDITYSRQLQNYILPSLGSLYIEDITVDDVQKLFNSISGSKATKTKVRVVLNQILEAALEDRLITFNPLRSRKLRITGAESTPTVPYTVEQMRFLVAHIADVKKPLDRAWCKC